MENREKLPFDFNLYKTGIYHAWDMGEQINVLGVKGDFAVGFTMGDAPIYSNVNTMYMTRIPRKVWVHVIESPDGILSARVTDYQDVSTYKGNVIVKQIEVEL